MFQIDGNESPPHTRAPELPPHWELFFGDECRRNAAKVEPLA